MCRQALLWGLDDDMGAEATAVLLEERGVMRVACLADGTAWALVDPALLQRLQARTRPRSRARLCAGFASGGRYASGVRRAAGLLDKDPVACR